MYIVVIVYCLEITTTTKICACSVQMQFSSCISSPQMVESTNANPMGMEGLAQGLAYHLSI